MLQGEKNWKIKNWHRFSIFNFELKMKWTNDPRTLNTNVNMKLKFSYHDTAKWPKVFKLYTKYLSFLVNMRLSIFLLVPYVLACLHDRKNWGKLQRNLRALDVSDVSQGMLLRESRMRYITWYTRDGNQNFRKLRSKTQWIGSVQPEKFRKNRSTFWGGPLFPDGPVGILVQWDFFIRFSFVVKKCHLLSTCYNCLVKVKNKNRVPTILLNVGSK